MQNCHLNLKTIAKVMMACFGLLPKVLIAMPGIDPNTPIRVQSDTASYDQLKHQAIHEGNVSMTQGHHELHADKLTIKKNPKGHLDVMIAQGKPASFTGVLTSDPEPVYATAKIIYYYPDKQLIVLEGLATLEHQKDKFQGPTLSYQLDKQVVSATSQSNERPTITFHPHVSQR